MCGRSLLRGRIWLGMAIVLLSGGLVWLTYLIFMPRMVVDIEVNGNTSLATAEILRLSGLKTGQVYELDELDRAVEVLGLHPFIRDVDINRIRINRSEKLLIKITERSCIALVQNSNKNNIIYEIDHNLMILSENRFRCRGVPLIQGSFQKGIDRFDDVLLKKLVESWKHINSLYPNLASRISEIRVRREGGMHLFLSGRAIRIDAINHLDETAIRQMYGTVSYLESKNITRAVVEIRGQEVLIRSTR